MVVIEELVTPHVRFDESHPSDRRFSLDQIEQRVRGLAIVEQGAEGTPLLKIKGLTLGLILPGEERHQAAARALKDVKADIANRPRHQGVIFFPWNTRLVSSPESAKLLAKIAISYTVAPEARSRSEQLDVVASAQRFLEQWLGRRERSTEHLKLFRQALRARIASSV